MSTFNPNFAMIAATDAFGLSFQLPDQGLLTRLFYAQVILFSGSGTWRNGTVYLADGFVGEHYNNTWDADYPFSMEISAGSLPPGLSLIQLDATKYEIDGTPTTVGAYTFDVRFGGSGGFTDTMYITINPTPDSGSSFVGGI